MAVKARLGAAAALLFFVVGSLSLNAAVAFECDNATITSDDEAEEWASCTSFSGPVTLTGELTGAGLEKLIFTHAGLLTVSKLDTLETLEGLQISNLTGLAIQNNAKLVSVDGLDKLAYVAGDLLVESNDALRDVTALTKSLRYVGGDVVISNNPYLCNDQVGTKDLKVEGTTSTDLSCVPITIAVSVLTGFVALTLVTCLVYDWRRRKSQYQEIN